MTFKAGGVCISLVGRCVAGVAGFRFAAGGPWQSPGARCVVVVTGFAKIRIYLIRVSLGFVCFCLVEHRVGGGLHKKKIVPTPRAKGVTLKL